MKHLKLKHLKTEHVGNYHLKRGQEHEEGSRLLDKVSKNQKLNRMEVSRAARRQGNSQ